MKTPRILMTVGALTAFSFSLGSDAFSQAQQPQQPGAQQQQPGAQQQQQFEGLRASDFRGSRVVNPEGQRLGTVDDIAVTLEDGTFAYAIIAAGGFLGIGGDLRPVPPEALHAREVAAGIEVVLDITGSEWDRAPTIAREQIHQLDQEARGQQLYEFYGQDWEARQQRVMEFAAPDRERDEPRVEDEDQQQQQIEQQLEQAMTQAGVDQQQAQQEAQRLAQQFTQEQPDQQEIEQQLEQAMTQAGVDQQQAQQEARRLSQQVHQQIEFGTPERRPEAQPGIVEEDPDRRARLFEPDQLRRPDELNTASDLMDARIENQQGQEIGQIRDFLLDLGQGRLGFALITTETGFWEMADEEFAVSPRAFDVVGNRLVLNVTTQDLETAQIVAHQQLQAQLEQQAQIAVDQARQSPQVFRYDDRNGAPGVFGAPIRDREDDLDLEIERERPEPSGPPAQRDGQPQTPGQN